VSAKQKAAREAARLSKISAIREECSDLADELADLAGRAKRAKNEELWAALCDLGIGLDDIANGQRG
jgi:hypothetical protein